MTSPQPRLTIDRRSPVRWTVTFANPPVNLIDAAMVGELQALLTEAEADDRLAVIVFDSADPDFFLAHWDIAADPALTDALPPGSTGMHPWLDVLIRLSRLPQVTISAIRGRARGAGSEFAQRVASFDVRALREVKAFVNTVSLPSEEEFPPQMTAFWTSVGRPETQERAAQLFGLGLQRGEVEPQLGSYLERLSPQQD